MSRRWLLLIVPASMLAGAVLAGVWFFGRLKGWW